MLGGIYTTRVGSSVSAALTGAVALAILVTGVATLLTLRSLSIRHGALPRITIGPGLAIEWLLVPDPDVQDGTEGECLDRRSS